MSWSSSSASAGRVRVDPYCCKGRSNRFLVLRASVHEWEWVGPVLVVMGRAGSASFVSSFALWASFATPPSPPAIDPLLPCFSELVGLKPPSQMVHVGL